MVDAEAAAFGGNSVRLLSLLRADLDTHRVTPLATYCSFDADAMHACRNAVHARGSHIAAVMSALRRQRVWNCVCKVPPPASVAAPVGGSSPMSVHLLAPKTMKSVATALPEGCILIVACVALSEYPFQVVHCIETGLLQGKLLRESHLSAWTDKHLQSFTRAWSTPRRA